MNTNNRELIIIGAGSLGNMVLDAALEMNKHKKIYFIDDGKEKGSLIHNHTVIGGIWLLDEINVDKYEFIIAIANNKSRKQIAEKYKLNYINVIHPNTSISRFSSLGIGNIILPNTSLDPNTVINNHVIINKNNSIGHNSELNDFSQVSPGCTFGGYTKLMAGVFIGMGVSLIPGTSINENSIIGAGTVVTKNIPKDVTAVGIPAKIIKE